MFLSMGHNRVAVLDGGLPAWLNAGYEVEAKRTVNPERGDFIANSSGDLFVDYQKVQAIMHEASHLVLDARAEERFKGLVEEPRPGLRSGHIPGAVNLPYTALLDKGKMKFPEELKNIFEQKMGVADNLIFSCGSGITACVLALGAAQLGWKRMAVYDGSWTEWGSLKELPIDRS